MSNFTVNELRENLKFFEKLYDVIRFVDPVKHSEIVVDTGKVTQIQSRCYDFWNKNGYCKNCISMRAYSENQTFIKLEYSFDKIFMVTAIPTNVEDRTVVVELLKDVTSSLIVGAAGTDTNANVIYSLINDMNNIVLKDVLTDAYNKRYINEKLPIDLINATLLEQDLSVIILDIDSFKCVNDSYGHLAGDQLMVEFVRVLTSFISDNDWIARFGGDEFLICLPNTSSADAKIIAENIRSDVERRDFNISNKKVKVTTSLGICTCKPHEISDMNQLIEIADKMLYLAKSNGKNSVESYEFSIK